MARRTTISKHTSIDRTTTAQHGRKISAGIPGWNRCSVIKEDNKHAGLLYVGSDTGAYASPDDGRTTWQVLGSELPLTFVHDLVIHPRDNIWCDCDSRAGNVHAGRAATATGDWPTAVAGRGG
jgi:hypothetical protein